MILSRSDSTDGDASGSLTNGQLLRDIEAISNALYLHRSTQNAPLITSSTRHQFAGEVQFSIRGLVAKPRSDREDMLSRSQSSWNWKKPLKALSHLRGRKLSCSFFLHVHSIEGLPSNFDDVSLIVQFGRKNEMITTRTSQILKGMADFDETLMHRCTVYCHRSGPDNSCKYEPKIFVIQASVVGLRGLDIGKHLVDLTRLLPLTFEELEGDKSSGKWTTSFKLAGKAKGAILNLSFGYLLTSDALLESSGNMTVSQLINLAYSSNVKQSGTRHGRFNSSGKFSRSGSVPGNLHRGSAPLSQLVDGITCREVLIPPALELSKSINFLYQKLDEGDMNCLIGSDASAEELGRSKEKPDSVPNPELVKQTEADEDDEIEFDIIEKGVELEVPEKEEASVAQSIAPADNFSRSEMVDVDEIFIDDKITYENKVSLSFGHEDEFAFYESKEKQSECATELTADQEPLSDFRELLISESLGLISQAVDEDCNTSSYMEVKSCYKANKLAKQSLSMDDACESVASDFLDMLENDQILPGWNSDSDPESPRERLLREFEKEALISGNFLLSPDETRDGSESSSGALVESDFGDDSVDHVVASLLEVAEEEHDMRFYSLRHRRKAIMLEDLEADALLHEWGFDDTAFQNSPRCHSNSGFGSPIELAPEEEPVESSALGEGFGPLVQTEGTLSCSVKQQKI